MGGRSAAHPRSGVGKRPAATAAALAVFAFLAAAAPAVSGGTKTLAVTATVLTRSNCSFYTGTSTLGFGALNPAVAADVNATTSVDFVCRGGPAFAVYLVTGNGGQNPSGPGARRMRHATAPEFLPYDLAFSPATGRVRRNRRQTLTISGTVHWTDFRGSMAGAYRDTVIVSIVP